MNKFFRKIKRFVRSPAQARLDGRHALVGPSRLWRMKRDFQIKFLRDMSLLPGHHLCEIGCGTLRGGIPIIRYLEEGHYCGIEVRESALNEARRELEEAGLEDKAPTLVISQDTSQISLDKRFDFIWAFSVLFHMNDETLKNALSFVKKHLKDNGVFYANVNIGEKAEGNWQGFPVVSRSFEFYESVCAKMDLTPTDIGNLRDLGHHSGKKSHDDQRMLKIVRTSLS